MLRNGFLLPFNLFYRYTSKYSQSHQWLNKYFDENALNLKGPCCFNRQTKSDDNDEHIAKESIGFKLNLKYTLECLFIY